MTLENPNNIQNNIDQMFDHLDLAMNDDTSMSDISIAVIFVFSLMYMFFWSQSTERKQRTA